MSIPPTESNIVVAVDGSPESDAAIHRPQRSTMSIEHARHAAITINVDEVDGRTRAVATMDWRGNKLVGVGRTRPYELLPDRIAEKRSVSRALSDLIARVDACDLDGVSGHPQSLRWLQGPTTPTQ
jgi:hypothetical protein